MGIRAALLAPAASMRRSALLWLLAGSANAQVHRTEVPSTSVLARPAEPLIELAVPTYSGSSDVVHPDVVRFPTPWHGWEYWMVFTPYGGSNNRIENPSIVVSHDGRSWTVPSGLRNPVIGTRPRPTFNSDPELFYDGIRERLVLLNRTVDSTDNTIESTTSYDGLHWTTPHVLLRAPNHELVSPTITLGETGLPELWYVDAGSKPCKTRRTTIVRRVAQVESKAQPNGDWSPEWIRPDTVILLQPDRTIWHIDVTYISPRSEYLAVYAAYRYGTCLPNDLFLARSADGLHWESTPVPLLRHQAAKWTESTLYRAALLYDPARDVVQVYVSARGRDTHWRIGLVEYEYADLMEGFERRGYREP